MPIYIRLTDYKSSEEKKRGFFYPKNRYEAKQEDFEKIPGSPIAYWVSDNFRNIFANSTNFKEINPPRIGMMTTDNNRFLKFWYEVYNENIGFNISSIQESINSHLKWFIYQKGGGSKKWYGHNEYIVNWQNAGQDIIENGMTSFRGKNFYFKKGLTWSDVNTNNFVCRYSSGGYIFDIKGTSSFPEKKNINFMLSFLNSKVVTTILNLLNPTISYQSGDISRLPIIFPEPKIIDRINKLTQQNINISKEEWDSRETSWDFTQNEILRILNDEFLILNEEKPTIETVYSRYCEYWREKFFTLHSNEKELNRLFIDIYELQDELTSDVELKDITILKNEAKIIDDKLVFQADEVIKQFISYAVGVMFGRYSLDSDGLLIANIGQDVPISTTFEIDDDNIIPIVDESDYFADDMSERFVEFVRVTFRVQNLQQNIAFIEKAIGKKIRTYFVKEFYKDHVKRYKKRPIYWLFTSAKGTFQVLIYMHRYTPNTLNHILNDYLRAFRIRLDTMRNEAVRITESEDINSREKTLFERKIEKIDKTLYDITEYEKVLSHYASQSIEINLDDGVKVNYCKFKELLVTFDKKICK